MALPTIEAAWPDCKFQCEAGDFGIYEVFLANETGMPLSPCDPDEGEMVQAYIWATLSGNVDRSSLVMLANITVDGMLVKSYWNSSDSCVGAIGECVLDTFDPLNGTANASIYGPINWICGQEVKLENIVISWGAKNESCADWCDSAEKCAQRTTKCYNATDIIVRPPPYPDFTITKTANKPAYEIGETITYTVNVTNIGEIELTNIEVFDDLTENSWNIPYLGVGDSNLTTFTYTVTERSRDICDGWIKNTVNATANWTYYKTKTIGPKYSYENVTIAVDSSLSITKTADTSGPVSPGDEIEYTIEVCNTGNLTVKNVTVNDSMFGNWSVGDLGKGACNTTTKIYTVSQDDICEGGINNTANASGVDYCNNSVQTLEDAEWKVQTEYNASLNIIKTANLSSANVGDVIEYTYTITNTGNVNLSNITLEDDRLGTINETE